MLPEIAAVSTSTSSSGPWWKALYDFSSLTKGIDTGLHSAMSPFWTTVTEMLIVGVLILVFYAIRRKKSMCFHAKPAWP